MKKFTLRLISAVFLVFVFQTCNQPFDQYPESNPFLNAPPGIEIAMEKIQDVKNLQEKLGDVWFRNPMVVGHGIGLDENGSPAIVVFTLEDVVQRKDKHIGNVGTGEHPLALPFEVDNVKIKPKTTGMFKVFADPTARFDRPVPIGVSVGHPDITAGTIGCRVTDGTNFYLLSNNHVLANSNLATKGDPILQPGPIDGGTLANDVIGTLYDYEPISFTDVNFMDAAIALVTSNELTASTPVGGYLTPGKTTKTATPGIKVQKYGRTTGHTFGTVDVINVTIDVCYESRGPFRCVKLARFTNQITITPGTFSKGGDSGSLIVTDDDHKNPVALLFAGSTTHTIGCPIDVVLQRFNVTVDDGGGGVTPPDVTDIAVTGITAVPATTTVGQTVAVSVNISNAGNTDIDAGFDVVLTDNGSTLNTWPVAGLSAGASQELTFDWNTANASLGTHTLIAVQNYSDDNNGNDSKSTVVTLNDVSTPSIVLTAEGSKVRGVRWVRLAWEGTEELVDIIIMKDGVEFNPVNTTQNGDNTADIELGKVSGVFTFEVCEEGSSNCSNVFQIVF
jgi:hypothetical protein